MKLNIRFRTNLLDTRIDYNITIQKLIEALNDPFKHTTITTRKEGKIEHLTSIDFYGPLEHQNVFNVNEFKTQFEAAKSVDRNVTQKVFLEQYFKLLFLDLINSLVEVFINSKTPININTLWFWEYAYKRRRYDVITQTEFAQWISKQGNVNDVQDLRNKINVYGLKNRVLDIHGENEFLITEKPNKTVYFAEQKDIREFLNYKIVWSLKENVTIDKLLITYDKKFATTHLTDTFDIPHIHIFDSHEDFVNYYLTKIMQTSKNMIAAAGESHRSQKRIYDIPLTLRVYSPFHQLLIQKCANLPFYNNMSNITYDINEIVNRINMVPVDGHLGAKVLLQDYIYDQLDTLLLPQNTNYTYHRLHKHIRRTTVNTPDPEKSNVRLNVTSNIQSSPLRITLIPQGCGVSEENYKISIQGPKLLEKIQKKALLGTSLHEIMHSPLLIDPEYNLSAHLIFDLDVVDQKFREVQATRNKEWLHFIDQINNSIYELEGFLGLSSYYEYKGSAFLYVAWVGAQMTGQLPYIDNVDGTITFKKIERLIKVDYQSFMLGLEILNFLYSLNYVPILNSDKETIDYVADIKELLKDSSIVVLTNNNYKMRESFYRAFGKIIKIIQTNIPYLKYKGKAFELALNQSLLDHTPTACFIDGSEASSLEEITQLIQTAINMKVTTPVGVLLPMLSIDAYNELIIYITKKGKMMMTHSINSLTQGFGGLIIFRSDNDEFNPDDQFQVNQLISELFLLPRKDDYDTESGIVEGRLPKVTESVKSGTLITQLVKHNNHSQLLTHLSNYSRVVNMFRNNSEVVGDEILSIITNQRALAVLSRRKFPLSNDDYDVPIDDIPELSTYTEIDYLIGGSNLSFYSTLAKFKLAKLKYFKNDLISIGSRALEEIELLSPQQRYIAVDPSITLDADSIANVTVIKSTIKTVADVEAIVQSEKLTKFDFIAISSLGYVETKAEYIEVLNLLADIINKYPESQILINLPRVPNILYVTTLERMCKIKITFQKDDNGEELVKMKLGRYDPIALLTWDEIVHALDGKGIKIEKKSVHNKPDINLAYSENVKFKINYKLCIRELESCMSLCKLSKVV